MQLDELYKYMYQENLFKSELVLDPRSLDELICKQYIPPEYKNKKESYQKDSQVHSARLVNISHGLKFIYFHFSESEAALEKLRQDLAKETAETLVRLDQSDLQINSFYLVRYQNELCRCILLTSIPNEENFYQIRLLESGKRVLIDNSMEFFVMWTRYHKYNTFAVHGRLTIGTGIEKVWTQEERTKFYAQIKLNTQYKIKLLSSIEPYVFEFVDDGSINFEFNSIISRALCGISLDQQTCLIGNYSASESDRFYLAGSFLFNTQNKTIDLFDQFNLAESEYVLYVHSEKLLSKLLRLFVVVFMMRGIYCLGA